MKNDGRFKPGVSSWNSGKAWPEEVRKNMSMAALSRIKKTHCPKGHEYTAENTYLNPNGGRRCRTCQRNTENNQDPQKKRKKWAQYNVALKIDVLTHYSTKGILGCSWAGCGVCDIDMLSLDHVENNGAEFRKTHISGTGTYKYLRKNGYPSGHQTLCFNHQWKKQLNLLRSRTIDALSKG